MEIIIKIADEDLMQNLNIIDGVKQLAYLLKPKSVPEFCPKTEEKTEKPYIEPEQEQELQEKQELQEEPLTEPQYSVEEVRKALVALAKEKGISAAKAILQKFNVAKVTDLKPQDYDAVMLSVKAVE